MAKRKGENNDPNGLDKEFDNLGGATGSRRKTTDSKIKKPYLIKLDPDFKDNLTKHFADKGLNFSAGVRMILHNYANEERLK